MELQGDQYPKGLSEDRVREIVRDEVVNLVQILKQEILTMPARADGNLNTRDFSQTLEIVERKVNRLVV